VAVSEPQRLALHRAARAALGEQEGDTLMALSPPANTDMATKQDVELVAAELRAHTLKVVLGTGLLLYLALVSTAFAAIDFVTSILGLA
jgi:hypothetical protein